MSNPNDLDPFAIFDHEAARLDRYFMGLNEAAWMRPSRCDGWTVRDVLGHLAGEEIYNHACLDDDVDGLFTRLRLGGGFGEFNEWCVMQRRGLPIAQVLAEWRTGNGETRRRMRALGPDVKLSTGAGPYPVGAQTLHYCSEYATHADDVGTPIEPGEEPGRTAWRARVGLFVLAEHGSSADVTVTRSGYEVRFQGAAARLSPADFVDATVGRLPDDHPLDRRVRQSLRCLA